MDTLSQRLSEFLSDQPPEREYILTAEERRIFRSLKAMGERATKGMQIEKCLFEVKRRGEQTTLQMVLEGRHAMMIANQVRRRFESQGDLKFADVVKTKRGGKVVLCPRGECDA